MGKKKHFEPQGEVVVRGPREGFTETLRINTSLLRRKIHNPDLVLEMLKVGQKTRTNVCIAYIAGIADDGVVQEVKNRIEDIKTDAILESGYIEQFIEDAPFSPFATIGNSEKPDVVGKITGGTSGNFSRRQSRSSNCSFLFIEGFQSAEDYYSRPYYSSLVRILRYMGFYLASMALVFCSGGGLSPGINPRRLDYYHFQCHGRHPFP